MAKKQHGIRASELEVGQAKAAFDAVLPELEALPASELQALRIDLQLAAAMAHSIAVRDSAPERRDTLAKLTSAGYFDPEVLPRIERVALAAWHIRRKQVEAMEATSHARIPEALVREAQDVRARMLRVLSHYFDDSPRYTARLVAIRAGTGHQDLANDLLAVSDLYEEAEVAAIVRQDPVHYRAEDPKSAREYAQVIFRALGLGTSSEAARWLELAQRAWLLLSRDYDALCLAGRLVFHDTEQVELSYPSLIAAVRQPGSRTRPQSQPSDPAPEPVGSVPAGSELAD